MKQLKPIEYQKTNEERMQKAVFTVMFDAMFKDVFAILKEYNTKSFDNASGFLSQALRNGRIQFVDGVFTGKMNARLSKELKSIGATFDKRTKKWKLPNAKLPPELATAVVLANLRFKRLHADIIKALDTDKVLEALKQSDFTPDYEKTMNGLERQFKDSVASIGIEAKLSDDMVKSLSDGYNTNMKLYINKWAEPSILKLREQVTKNVFDGARAENLVGMIKKEYGVSQRKAKFLASQETRLLTGKFTEERYKSAGVTKYRWSTSNDSRVRSEHKHLHGKIFSWGEAVIDDEGTRGNPKEAFGCRCKAIPVFDA